MLIIDFTDDLMEEVCHNAAILSTLSAFNLKELDMLHIVFIFKKGDKPLFKLFKSLLEIESKVKADSNVNAHLNSLKCIILS
jgi:hypothetical protein